MRCMSFDVSCVLLVITSCFGEDRPSTAAKVTPAPVQVQAMPKQNPGNLFIQQPMTMYEHGTREYWSNYGVDSTGHYRPRVIMSPYGEYYFYDGSNYPWLTTHSNSVLKYELD